MERKVVIIIVASLLIFGLIAVEFSEGYIEKLLFNTIPYNYTSYVTIPPSGNTGTLGGYYIIFGKGTDFNFEIKLSGAENFEDPLCYTADGLNGTGKIDKIIVTFDTIYALISGDFRKAMLSTIFSGKYNMKCAAWTGHGDFSSDGNNVTSNFVINGHDTYWEGKFNLIAAGNRIVVPANYIWYPNNNPSELHNVNKTYYL
ncbi:MAG: hypothetical protein HZC47_08245 [Methanobacterium sp.]|uniref:hypothetical protein n=1 Tax=Methanobacterium sp. TaxID=2164 RepID=UPI003D65535F|nr:hypothetical protein [Methanobacterium sp.]